MYDVSHVTYNIWKYHNKNDIPIIFSFLRFKKYFYIIFVQFIQHVYIFLAKCCDLLNKKWGIYEGGHF